MSFTLGIDLGQVSDYTAIAIIEERPTGTNLVRHLERVRGVTYPRIVQRIAELVGSLPSHADLAVDATGVGRPVVDMIRAARIPADLYAITITGGGSVTRSGLEWRVPKRDLASTVAILLQTGRLRIAPSLQEAGNLERELQAFRVKVSVDGHDSYEAWREGDHDDLVLAVAMAVWLNEKGRNAWLQIVREARERNEAAEAARRT